MRLPQPPLLLTTDRRQARRPLIEVVAHAIRAGCRWISLREKDLSEDDQIALVGAVLPIAWGHGARVSLHGDPALAKVANVDGVHLAARSNLIAARKLLGADKLVGVSIHTVTEAEAIDPGVVDYAIAGPASRPEASLAMAPRLAASGLRRSPLRRVSPSSRLVASMRCGRLRCLRQVRPASR